MLQNQLWLRLGYSTFIAMTVPFALSTILGCGGGGESSSLTSNLTTPPSTARISSSAETDALSSDVTTLPDEIDRNAEESLEDAHTPALDESGVSSAAGSPSMSTDSESVEEQEADSSPPQPPIGTPVVAVNSTPTGASATVMWEPSTDSHVNGYYIYYGRQQSEEQGVCSYEGRYAVDSPSVMIMDLEPNTPYFFAVSSYSGLESPCSKETLVITPPASPHYS
jgi:Fibronectin type III domain